MYIYFIIPYNYPFDNLELLVFKLYKISTVTNLIIIIVTVPE